VWTLFFPAVIGLVQSPPSAGPFSPRNSSVVRMPLAFLKEGFFFLDGPGPLSPAAQTRYNPYFFFFLASPPLHQETSLGTSRPRRS